MQEQSEPAIGNWEHIADIAQHMAMAFDEPDEREEIKSLIAWSTERQRSRMWQELWWQGSVSWRERAVRWMTREAAK